MKSKAFLVSLIAFLAIAFALSFVSAFSDNTDLCDGYDTSEDRIQITDVEFNGVSIRLDRIDDPFTIAGTISETVPVVVKFTAHDDSDDCREEITDVRVKVYLEGFKDDIEDETPRFHILEGNTYVKKFNLKLPSSIDLDELTEEKLRLLVRLSARGHESIERFINIEVQRELYSINLLSIERMEVVEAGNQLAVDVVVQNNGFERLDNVYVRVSIPSLGVSNKVYVGDLESQRDRFDDDINDARERRIYLTIPKGTAPGNYEMEIEAYNHDTNIREMKRVLIRGVDTKILPQVTTKTIAPGEETTFDIILVNPSNRMVIYTITPEEAKGFFVEAVEPIVTVNADSSRATKIKVRASDSVGDGTYVVAVNTNTDSSSDKVSFTVNVKKPLVTPDKVTTGLGKTDTVVVLTVILVIIFVVLLIILIVLLTKKPSETEELGETNYY